MDEIEKQIWIFVLENAIGYKGKAHGGAIVGKVFGQFPESRKKGKEINATIKKIVAEVNEFSLEEQKYRLDQLAPGYLLQKELQREARKGSHSQLRDLEN